MTDDIVTRLREIADADVYRADISVSKLYEAADEIERLRTELTEWKMVATDYRSHHLGDAYGECDCDPCERYQTTKRNYATVVVVKVNLTKEKMHEIWHQSVDKVFRDE